MLRHLKLVFKWNFQTIWLLNGVMIQDSGLIQPKIMHRKTN